MDGGGSGAARVHPDGFFFVCLFVCFCFFVSHFLKPLKFVWGVPKCKISTGKKHISRRGKSGKETLPPLKNIPVTPLSPIGDKMVSKSHRRV